MGRVVYTTREEVMDAFDVKESSHRSAQIDSAIASASDDIDGWLNRHKHGLAPRNATRYFRWPQQSYGQAWRLWLDEDELVSVSALTSGGATVASYFLEPVNSGPPYTNIEIDLSSQSSFSSGATAQRAVSITGVWGINNDQRAAGALAAAVASTSVTVIDVTDASPVGVGSVLTIDSERLTVTGRGALTTGQSLQSSMNAAKNDVTVDVLDGTALHVGETVLIGGERMKVLDVVGGSVTVERAADGSVLAAHSASDVIYAYRRLTVVRGELGTTAATHLNGAPVTVWDVPALVRDLCRAEAIVRLEQEWSAYGERVYSDEAERDSSGTEVVAGRGLTDLRKSCARRYKRKLRKRAI